MKRISTAIMLVVAIAAAAGCDSSSPRTPPTSPTPPYRPSASTFVLSGMVTEETSTGVSPVAGALVQEQWSRLSATTDADGRYRISGLPPGTRVIRTTSYGYVTSTSTVDISADALLDVRIVAIPTFILSGAVFETTPSGRAAVEGVEVYCIMCHSASDSDDQGRYRFALANGVHQFYVTKAGYALVNRAGTHGQGLEFIYVTVDGDTHFDIEVVRR